jgi:hypothetical protein
MTKVVDKLRCLFSECLVEDAYTTSLLITYHFLAEVCNKILLSCKVKKKGKVVPVLN